MIYLWAIIFLMTLFIIFMSAWNRTRKPEKRRDNVVEIFAMSYFYIIILYLLVTIQYIK